MLGFGADVDRRDRDGCALTYSLYFTFNLTHWSTLTLDASWRRQAARFKDRSIGLPGLFGRREVGGKEIVKNGDDGLGPVGIMKRARMIRTKPFVLLVVLERSQRVDVVEERVAIKRIRV